MCVCFTFARFQGRPQTLDLIQSNSVVVERAAFYLASALQSSPEDDPVFGPDSPPVSLECKEQARPERCVWDHFKGSNSRPEMANTTKPHAHRFLTGKDRRASF